MIRNAEPKDLDQLCDLAERFIAESDLPYTYDPVLTRQHFWEAIHEDETIIILAVEEDIVAGIVMGYVARDFCVESSAYLTKLYVEKEFRGIIGAKHLIAAFEEATKEAVITFASATGGVGDEIEKIFVNLFEKSGYSVLGRILIKERKHE